MAHKRIPQIEQLSSELQELFNVLNDGQDLSVILIGTSFLDTSLSSILERKIRKGKVSKKMLESGRGMLGTFASRADACYVLGLIEKPIYKDLLTIGEIRNKIAHHHLALDFDDENIKNLCSKLSYMGSAESFKSFDSDPENQPLWLADLMVGARNQFILSVVMISQRLLLIGLGIKRN